MPALPLPVCEPWYEIEPVTPSLFRISEPHVDVLLRANAWLQLGRDRDLLVDAGNGIAAILPTVQRLRRKPDQPLIAFATHAHQDHAGGLWEFEDRRMHPGDVEALAAPTRLLYAADIGPATRQLILECGGQLPELLIEAVPHRGFDVEGFRPRPTTLTHRVDEGAVLDLGDHRYEVLHLPGHTHGSAGLWERATGTLFSGDAVYATDPLIDTTSTSSIPAYVETMRRLRQLPVSIVRPGHDFSFGRDLLIERCDTYIARRSHLASETVRGPVRSTPASNLL